MQDTAIKLRYATNIDRLPLQLTEPVPVLVGVIVGVGVPVCVLDCVLVRVGVDEGTAGTTMTARYALFAGAVDSSV